jgi:hypothetical protein
MYKVKLIKLIETGEITGLVNLPFIPQKGHAIEFLSEQNVASDGIIAEIFIITNTWDEWENNIGLFSHFEVYLD